MLLVLAAASAGVKVATARLPSPKTLVGSPTQLLAHLPKQQSPKQLQPSSPVGATGVSQNTSPCPGSKPTIQIKQESGRKAGMMFSQISTAVQHVREHVIC